MSADDDELDRALVARVQQGQKAAFDLLVKKYQARVLALVQRLVRDRAEAEDVAQEAFIRAYRALVNFRGDSAFYTWLYRIAINTAKNHLVARSRRVPEQDLDIHDAEHLDVAEALRHGHGPEGEALSAELERAVNQAIALLPLELRTAITLREFDGLSYEDIAEIMACPVGTVRSRIFRAREEIDRAIGPWLEA